MMTSKERAGLKAKANAIPTIFQVGWQGIGENLIAQVDGALESKELIKLRVLPTSPLMAWEAAEQLSSACKAETVQVIGTKIVLYRKKNQKPPKAKPLKKKLFKTAKEKPFENRNDRSPGQEISSFHTPKYGNRQDGETPLRHRQEHPAFGKRSDRTYQKPGNSAKKQADFRGGKFTKNGEPASSERKPAAQRRPSFRPVKKSTRGKNDFRR